MLKRYLCPDTQQILCAILNRITNFDSSFGSLIYLNWYAGETSTAVIVANVPHLWPLLSRVFNLGAFKSANGPSGSNKFPLHSHRSNGGVPNSQRNKYDIHGYVTTESEERIANAGDKDGQWGYDKQNVSKSGDGDLELGDKYMTNNAKGAGRGNVGDVGVVVEEEELGGWETNDRADMNK